MGQSARCSECKFEFQGGHSHHTGDSDALCLKCMTAFSLPTASAWGPKIGERITLWRRRVVGEGSDQRIEPEATGVSFETVKGKEFELLGRKQALVNYPIEDVPCPDCHERSLVVGFEDGAPCPGCETGRLRCSVLYY